AVGVGVRALVAEVGDLALVGALERLRERERGRRVIGSPAGARVDDRLGGPVRDAHEGHDGPGVVVQDRLDQPWLAERGRARCARGASAAAPRPPAGRGTGAAAIRARRLSWTPCPAGTRTWPCRP